MAARNNVLFGLILLVATCSTAPSDDINHASMEHDVPEECKGKTGFCYIKPKNYDNLVKDMDAALLPYMKQDYGDRSGENVCETQYKETIDEENCSFETRTERPFLYIEKSDDQQQNDTINILVQTKLYTQCIRTVKCKQEGVSETGATHQCFKQILNSDFTSSCLTTNVEQTLYIYDWLSDKVVPKKFFIPACCSCNIERIF